MLNLDAYNRQVIKRSKSSNLPQDTIVGIGFDGRLVTYAESMFGTNPKTGKCSGTPYRPLSDEEKQEGGG